MRIHQMTEPEAVRPVHNPAAAVHGTVLAGALIAVQGAHDDPDISRLVSLVVITQVVYWLAHVYAELVGERITHQRSPSRRPAHLLNEEWPLVAVSFGPIAVILAFSAFGASSNEAILAGLIAVMVLLAGWAVLAGYRSGLKRVEMLLYVAASLGIGLALVAIKTLLH